MLPSENNENQKEEINMDLESPNITVSENDEKDSDIMTVKNDGKWDGYEQCLLALEKIKKDGLSEPIMGAGLYGQILNENGNRFLLIGDFKIKLDLKLSRNEKKNKGKLDSIEDMKAVSGTLDYLDGKFTLEKAISCFLLDLNIRHARIITGGIIDSRIPPAWYTHYN